MKKIEKREQKTFTTYKLLINHMFDIENEKITIKYKTGLLE